MFDWLKKQIAALTNEEAASFFKLAQAAVNSRLLNARSEPLDDLRVPREESGNPNYAKEMAAEREKKKTAYLEASATLGPEAPETLQAQLQHVLFSVMASKKWKEAEEEFKAIAKIQERVLGPFHEDTLEARHFAADMVLGGGRPGEALLLYEQILSNCDLKLGRDHPQTLRTLHTLSRLRGQFQQWESATKGYWRLLATHSRLHGVASKEAENASKELADVLHWQKLDSESEPVLLSVLEACRKQLGDNNKITLNAIKRLALHFLHIGCEDKALPLIRESLKIAKEVWTEQSEAYAEDVNNLAGYHHRRKEFKEAERLFRQALATMERLPNADKSIVASVARSLGYCLCDANKWESGGRALEKAALLAAKAFGAKSENVSKLKADSKKAQQRAQHEKRGGR